MQFIWWISQNNSSWISFMSAPCPPTNLTARADCGTNLGTLSWAPSVHAVSYTATVTGTHGHVVSCSSNTTTCSVKLDCGHKYTAVVIASSLTCNSSTGASLTFDSGKWHLLLFSNSKPMNEWLDHTSSFLSPFHSFLSAWQCDGRAELQWQHLCGAVEGELQRTRHLHRDGHR